MKNRRPSFHILTVDAEDWPALMCMYLGHPVPASRHFSDSLRHVMDLFDTCGVKATFFVVAKHAQDAPEIIKEIVSRGHELASHGWTHRKTFRLSSQTFAEEVKRSVATLEDIAGVKVRGYRTPFFSVLPEHPWALEALAEAGIEYDSSIATVLWERAGARISDQPFLFELPNGSTIAELPIPAKRWGPFTVRLIGGRCLRVLPRSVSFCHVQQCEATGRAAMMYLHSYEVPGLPMAAHVPGVVGIKRLAIYASALAFQIGLRRMHRIVTELLSVYRWSPACDVPAALAAAGRLPKIRWLP